MSSGMFGSRTVWFWRHYDPLKLL